MIIKPPIIPKDVDRYVAQAALIDPVPPAVRQGELWQEAGNASR